VRSSSCVLHLIEGAARVKVGEEEFSLSAADTCCAPGYTPLSLHNQSASAPAWFFMADDAPFQKKLGVYEVRA
jgi:gentisate 1,2-dioxygenase